VTAIRNAGATNHQILITGVSWSAAYWFVKVFAGSFGPLENVHNPDGSFDNITILVHQYVHGAGGMTPACTDWQIVDIFKNAADVPGKMGRRGMVTEFGGGNNQGCVDMICGIMDIIK
jgi:endoglucanase